MRGNDNGEGKETAQHRHGRLRLHGPGPFQRLSPGRQLLRPRLPAGAQGRRGRNKERPAAFADTWGYESIETDWKDLVKRDDIDAIDICVPNDLHIDIADRRGQGRQDGALREAARPRRRRKARRWSRRSRRPASPTWSGTITAGSRRSRLIKQIVDSGRLGKIFHYRANFLQDWTISPDVPQGGAGTWRLDVEAAGSGVTGDLLAHCIDTAMWINGSITTSPR